MLMMIDLMMILIMMIGKGNTNGDSNNDGSLYDNVAKLKQVC